MKRPRSAMLSIAFVLGLTALVLTGASVSHACDDDVKKNPVKPTDSSVKWFTAVDGSGGWVFDSPQWIVGDGNNANWFYASPLQANDDSSAYFVAPGDDKLAAYWFNDGNHAFYNGAYGFRGYEWNDKKVVLSINYKDGKLSVKHNGQVVSDDKVERKGDKVIVKGVDGKELGTFTLKAGGAVLPQAGWELSLRPNLTQAWRSSGDGTLIIGVNLGSVGDALASHLDIDAKDAIIITEVLDDYPAKKAGLRKHDVITHINGQAPVSSEALREILKGKEAGYEVKLTIVRGGKSTEITVAAAPRKSPFAITRYRNNFRFPAIKTNFLQPRPFKVETDLLLPKGGRIYSPRVRFWNQNPVQLEVEKKSTVEERLERLEKLLEKLLEGKEKKL